MKNEISTSGMIIKETKVGEGNKIFTIITTNMGKIQASGAGVRSFKSKIGSGCSLFCYSDFKLRQGKSRDILNIVSAERQMSFFDIGYDIEKLALANYICDLANRFTVLREDSEQILRLLLNTMYYIQKNDYDLKVKPVFELRLLVSSGLAPQIDACSKCGSRENLIHFSPDNFGVECSSCSSVQNILPGTLKAMDYIIKSPSKSIFSFSASDDVLSQLTAFAEQCVLDHIGSMPKPLTYLKSL